MSDNDIKNVVIGADGNVLNVGPWEPRDRIDDAGMIVHDAALPEGSTIADCQIAETATGRQVLDTDYRSLRAEAYPSIGDQLDSLYHAGLFPQQMSDAIQAIKDRYPKPPSLTD